MLAWIVLELLALLILDCYHGSVGAVNRARSGLLALPVLGCWQGQFWAVGRARSGLLALLVLGCQHCQIWAISIARSGLLAGPDLRCWHGIKNHPAESFGLVLNENIQFLFFNFVSCYVWFKMVLRVEASDKDTVKNQPPCCCLTSNRKCVGRISLENLPAKQLLQEEPC